MPEEIEEALQDINAPLRPIDRALDGHTLVETLRSRILREMIQAYIEMDIVEQNEGPDRLGRSSESQLGQTRGGK